MGRRRGFRGRVSDANKPAEDQEEEAGIGGVQNEIDYLIVLEMRGKKAPLQGQASKEKGSKEMAVAVVRLPG